MIVLTYCPSKHLKYLVEVSIHHQSCFCHQVSRASVVSAAVRLPGDSSSSLPLHGPGILGQPGRSQRSQASHPNCGAQRENSSPAHQRQKTTAGEGPVTRGKLLDLLWIYRLIVSMGFMKWYSSFKLKASMFKELLS